MKKPRTTQETQQNVWIQKK